jgi:hypothetical protein
MKRMTQKIWRTLMCLISLYGFAVPHARAVEVGEGNFALPGAGARAIMPVGPEILKLETPATLGGVSVLGVQTPGIITVSPIYQAVTPETTLSGLMPAPAADGLLPQQPGISGLAKPEPTALDIAQGLAATAANAEKSGAPQQVEAASDKAFDGVKAASGGGADVPGGGGSNNGGNGGGNNNGGSNNDDGGKLNRLQPRVVMILDTLKAPASEKMTHYIETLLDNGVHVVFVTPRADKGENSAESVLISKLKIRTGNPIVVVSYNGARVAAHSSKAENPKPLIEDQPGFSANTIDLFHKITAGVEAKIGFKGMPKEFGMPSSENPLIYGADLPQGKDFDSAGFQRAYNSALRSRGLKYKIEVVEEANGRRYFYTQSTALKLNTGRIFKGIYAQFPELRDDLKAEHVLVLADSTKAQNFLKTLGSEESVQGKGFYIHGTKDGAGIEEALAAVLGKSAFEKVVVQRNQLRGYTEWLDARAKWGDAPKGESKGKGGGGYHMPASHSRYYRDLGFYRGILMYDMMGRIYHMIRKGQYHEATLESSLDVLSRMWYTPRAMGVRITPEMDAARQSPRWKALQKGYLETSKVWLRNYYQRNFKDFPHNVSENVVGKMINLARDSKNSINIEYQSPYTGRRYVVYVRPARTELDRDDKGNILVAHVYRTGKEPYETEFDDNIEVNLVAHAMLQGYGEKRADGHWYVNDEADPRVKVVFHYNTRDLSRTQTPNEIESHSADVTATIEKMQTDKEFLEHWEEQEAKNNKASAGAAKKKAAPKKAPPKGNNTKSGS